jgi:benzoyl-CoA reductase/2-hydroxyglutaryl-CoA dehydratase subunit BcrC/BadD/HgdB
MTIKYTAEDATKQKFVVGNYLRWQMVEDKEIKAQINEYHKLLEELNGEKIDLPDVFVAGALVEKLSSSWNDYKQQLKHKHVLMSLADIIKHIIIEDTSRKECDTARAKALESRANLVQNNARKQKRYENKTDHVLGVTKPNFKANCYVCGKPGHKAYHCSLQI